MMLKVGLAQLNSNDDIQRNFQQIVEIIDHARNEKPDLIVFPENSLFFRIDPAQGVEALSLNHEIFQKLENQSSSTGMAFHLTTAIKDVDQKVFNASVMIEPGQKAVVLYRKVHLFDIALKDQKPIRESDSFTSGSAENIFQFKGLRWGSSICYDIRFSEIYLKYAKSEVDVILVPAAFLVKTGQAHWQVLLRARAIESQCYVLAPAQHGKHISQTDHQKFRETYGHTMAVDPWGQVLRLRSAGIGIEYVEIQKTEIENVRRQIPMKDHRRL